MIPYTKRNYSRNNYKAHILYSDYATDNYIDAEMLNYSLGGMYFEASQESQPGSDICVKMVKYSPDTLGPEAYKAYRAKIKWCKKKHKKSASRYGLGVQYIDKSHIIFTGRASTISCSCDLCGDSKPSRDIYKEDDGIYLCHNCYKHISTLPDGRIKASIKRFLVGNIV